MIVSGKAIVNKLNLAARHNDVQLQLTYQQAFPHSRSVASESPGSRAGGLLAFTSHGRDPLGLLRRTDGPRTKADPSLGL
jgi:hypothetical protein